MPKSKKPRKPYNPSGRPTYSMFLPEVVKKNFDEIFDNIGLIAEQKFPRGNLNRNDLLMMRDALHLAQSLFMVGNYIPEDWKKEHWEKFTEYRQSFSNFYFRVLRTKCFTAYSEEIKGIMWLFEAVTEILRTEREFELAWVLDVYKAVIHLTMTNVNGELTLDAETIRKTAKDLRWKRIR
jgi:hypothetical protein